ncbi:non-functional NADPH-dependent codeinone reductase 2-like [Chenopodium quinoa]|uniref:non-functional NADPH-dependent codeinone reductase 2-like n=1 Tax=Chenopodium quinoa TaxID=63459 RepID=UPI000B77F506|nr:non-functional NADPH-dependent codeinone reductase 2-like [Chenopodium quinoa]
MIPVDPLRLRTIHLTTQSKMTTPPSQLRVPQIKVSHGERSIPVIGLGTAVDPPVSADEMKSAVLRAIEVGYRHFDTAHKYKSEQPIGDAVQEALSLGLVQSRDELFITSKLWCGDAHPNLVVPGLQKSLRNLKMEWIDLYLIHWPLSCQPGKNDFPIKEDDFLPMDFQGVWAAMEECQKLGLAKCIGVSNFSCKKLNDLLVIAKIPPAVNQVEVSPFWQQKKLIDLCKENGILITAYSPLGAIGTFYGSNRILESEVLQEIAKSKGKSIPQVCLRWAYEQGITIVVKSFNKERIKENLMIFDWELTEEDHEKIRGIPQSRGVTGWPYLSKKGPFKTLEELWDGEL